MASDPFKDLRSWLETHGGFVSEKLAFQDLPSGDRGVVAIEDIAESEGLVLVPIASCCLNLPKPEELKQ